MAKSNYSLKQVLSPDFTMPTNYEELQKVYRTMAKAADQRLVRLEELQQNNETFKNVTKWAYARAQEDLKRFIPEQQRINKEHLRFNTVPIADNKGRVNYQNLVGRVNAVKLFLNAPTSTKAGTKAVFQNRADIINAKYGTEFDWESLAKYYQSGLADKMDKYGYETAFKAVSVIMKKEKEAIDGIKKASDIIDTAVDEVLEQKVKSIAKEFGKEILSSLL